MLLALNDNLLWSNLIPLLNLLHTTLITCTLDSFILVQYLHFLCLSFYLSFQTNKMSLYLSQLELSVSLNSFRHVLVHMASIVVAIFRSLLLFHLIGLIFILIIFLFFYNAKVSYFPFFSFLFYLFFHLLFINVRHFRLISCDR